MKYFTTKLQRFRELDSKMWNGIWVALTLTLIAGCATPPPPAGLAQPWPESPPNGYAMLLMYRHDNGGGGPEIFIDNTKVFDMRGDCYSWIYIRSGEHRFRTKGVRMFGNLNFDTEINFAPRKSYYLTLYQRIDNYVYFKKIKSDMRFVTEQIAKQATTNCWFSKPLVPQIDTPGRQPKGSITNTPELKTTVPTVL